VDENQKPFDQRGGVTESVSWSRLQLNHYYTRSEEEFLRKIGRLRVYDGEPYRGGGEKLFRGSLDEERDDVILSYVPALRKALAEREEAVQDPRR
jgi:hypothetical protein